MAYIRAGASGGGGSAETTLWTNSNPDTAFGANQTITLSDNISNYDYIKIYYRSSTTSSNYTSVIIPTDAFYSKATENPVFSIGGIYLYGGTPTPMARYVYYVSDTSINIVNSANQAATGNIGIPINVYGIKTS